MLVAFTKGICFAEPIVTELPEGVAQVPSPLQNVEDDAEVPELRFVTGRFPVTPVAKDTFVIVLFEPLITLFVSVSEPANVESVPVVGSVTFVAPVVVRVKEFAPDVIKFPASVNVFP